MKLDHRASIQVLYDIMIVYCNSTVVILVRSNKGAICQLGLLNHHILSPSLSRSLKELERGKTWDVPFSCGGEIGAP